MKRIAIILSMIILLSINIYAVTIGIGTEFWADGTGMHINVTYPFTTNLSEVSTNQINISSDDYQLINVKSLNSTVQSNITFKGLGDYSQIFNGTSIYPEAENVNNYIQNISPLNRSIIVSIPLNIFRFVSIDTTIDTVQYQLSGSDMFSGSLIVNISGTGNVELSFLVSHGAVNIYRNGIYIATLPQSNNNYIMSSGGVWTFSPNTNINVIYTPISNGLTIFASGLTLVILTLLFSVIIGIYKQKKETGYIDWGKLITNMSIIIGIMIIILMGLAVISVMINTL